MRSQDRKHDSNRSGDNLGFINTVTQEVCLIPSQAVAKSKEFLATIPMRLLPKALAQLRTKFI
jgi:hypothetical protein